MEYPCLIWLMAMSFLPCVLVAILQRPPLTARGRVFYALAGVLGLATGGHWLFCLALGRGLWSRKSVPKPLLDVVEDMAKNGDVAVWLACAFLAAGTVSCLWAMFGPDHRVTEE